MIDDKFSYTIYDELGRITEAGEAGDPELGAQNFLDSINNNNYPFAELKRDYMRAYYEQGYLADASIENSFSDGQKNLRNRIGAVEQRMAQYDVLSGDIIVIEGTQVQLITSYSYDFHGNVKELVQTNSDLEEHNQQHKLITYSYDLISGNVKEVSFQKDSMDEWNHRYHYDAMNRLVRAWTSDDGEEWEMDVKQFYYLHGSLARTETGHDKVQGTDYAFNMQGWLKGVNSTTLQADRDMGQDAHTSGLDKYSGADVFGYSLGYFDGDYTPVAGTAFANTDDLISANGAYGSLYNGNISHMVTAMKEDDEAMLDVLGNIYKYDQLQRIKSMDVYSVATQATYISNNSFSGASLYNGGAYKESYSFDKNGNLDSLKRYNSSATLMDNFKYNYDGAKKNRLLWVDDAASTTVSTVDIDDQSSGNYSYNAIGQLVSDAQENIDSIAWTVTGKVRKVFQSDGSNTEFIYDAMGNRVMKIEEGINEIGAVYTYYIYDASGNVMSTYQRGVFAIIGGTEDYKDQLKLEERMIYGSKRVGVKNEKREMASFEFTPTSVNGSGFYQAYSGTTAVIEFPENFEKEKRKVGEKYYEFSEHRGNVLDVTTDQKIRNSSETGYDANVVSYSDYGPYGNLLDNRNGSTNVYLFSFQGQEDDPEIKGEGNSVNYKYRMYDPRIGRFFAVDPLAAKYPHYSPYSFSGNKVIAFRELEGLEETSANGTTYTTPDGGNIYLPAGVNSSAVVFGSNEDHLMHNVDGPSGIFFTTSDNVLQSFVLGGEKYNAAFESGVFIGYQSSTNSDHFIGSYRRCLPVVDGSQFSIHSSTNDLQEVQGVDYSTTSTAMITSTTTAIGRLANPGTMVVSRAIPYVAAGAMLWTVYEVASSVYDISREITISAPAIGSKVESIVIPFPYHGNSKDNSNPHIVYEIYGISSTGKETLKFGVADQKYNTYGGAGNNRPQSQLAALRLKYPYMMVSYTIVARTNDRYSALLLEAACVTQYFMTHGITPPEQFLPNPFSTP